MATVKLGNGFQPDHAQNIVNAINQLRYSSGSSVPSDNAAAAFSEMPVTRKACTRVSAKRCDVQVACSLEKPFVECCNDNIAAS